MADDHYTWNRYDHVTLSDVAREAGVSQSAASVVLNGAQSGTRVSRDKRRQVVEIAQRMGYRPNALARSLITGRTNLLGIYSGRSRLDSRNSFFAELLGGVFQGAAQFGANTVVHTTGTGSDELLELVSNRALDGLIIHVAQDDPILRLIGEFRLPAVSVADSGMGVPSVVVDDWAGGTLQAQHLAMLGHKHVLIKTSPYQPSAEIRCKAFQEAASRLGLQVTVRFETFGENEGLDLDDIRLLTEGASRATAVVGWNDNVAHHICTKLDALGVEIPAEVAVVGFDGFNQWFAPKYKLTTIRAPWSEVGAMAANSIFSMIDRNPVPDVTVAPVEFVRGSTT